MKGNLTNTLELSNMFIRHELRIELPPVKGLSVSILAPHTCSSAKRTQ